MDRRTERKINRYIRYKTGPERLALALSIAFFVGMLILGLGAYMLGAISRATR